MIPTETIYPLFMTFPVEESFNDKFDRMDYDSYYAIMNIGFVGILFAILLLNYPIYFIFKWSNCNCARNVRNRWEHGLFWNDTILFIKEAYLEIVISVLLQFHIFWESWDVDYFWSNFSNCLAIFCLFITLGILIVILLYIWPNHA